MEKLSHYHWSSSIHGKLWSLSLIRWCPWSMDNIHLEKQQSKKRICNKSCNCAISNKMNIAVPELEKDREFTGQLIRDLYARGLISGDMSTMNTMMSESGVYSSRTTPLGKKFLQFIILPMKS